jgi:diamine N-acetyltransferase
MIELLPITPENHLSARELRVRPDQEQFVAGIEKTLADAFVWKSGEFRVAFHEGVPVGYVLVFPFEQDGQQVVNIVRLMVDVQFQGKGLGRGLLNKTLEWIGSFTPFVDLVRISTLPQNQVAVTLYKSSGFIERGVEDGEIALYRALSPPDVPVI